jgi:NADH-quinone oxidoreductase subunit C
MTNENSDAAAEAAPPDFSGTIWAEVDRALSGVTVRPELGVLDLIVHIPPDEVIMGLRRLKTDEALNFNYLRSLTAVDLVEVGMDVVYHLYSTNTKKNLTVKARLDNADPVLDTATTVWKAANWLERETAEMFGIRFNGHPDPRTLLMPEDMTDTFPLRKSHPLAEIEILQGEGMGYPEEGE